MGAREWKPVHDERGRYHMVIGCWILLVMEKSIEPQSARQHPGETDPLRTAAAGDHSHLSPDCCDQATHLAGTGGRGAGQASDTTVPPHAFGMLDIASSSYGVLSPA
jgi:hypothetical protein